MCPLMSVTEILLNSNDKPAQGSVCVLSLAHLVRTMSNVKVLPFCRRGCHGTHVIIHAMLDVARKFWFLVVEGAFSQKLASIASLPTALIVSCLSRKHDSLA